MASIKDLISSLKKTKDKAISDNEGWIRQNKFTPVKQVQQMGQNLSAWGNIANQGIKNQIDIQKRDFNQYLWKPLKENPVLTPTLNRFEQATPAIGNQLRQLNPFSPKQTPQQNWQDTKKIGAAALTAYGLAKAPFAAMMGGAVINPIVKLGTNVYQNKKGEQLNKQLSQIGQSRTDVPLFAQQKPYQQKKITEGVVNAIPEGAGTGLANAGTTRLTNYLVQSLSKTLPFLKPLTEEAIKKSAPVVTDTTKEAVKKVFDVGTKRLVKAAVIETAVESPIWATLTQTEQESYIQALMRETEQNLIMNIGMAGVNTLGDSKAMLPIINKTIKETVNNAFYNPDGSLKMRSGATRLLTPDISTPEVKTGGVSTPQNKGNKYSFANTNYGIQKNNDGSFSVKEDRIGNSTKTLLEQKIPDDLGKEYQDLLNQKDALKGSGLSTEATNKRMDIQNKLGDLTDRIIRKLGLEDLGIVISKDGKIIRDNIDGEANKLAEELYKIGKLTPELTKQFQENPKQFLLDNSKSQISPEVKTGEGGKTFYHGTKADFDKFDDTKLGSNTEWLNSKWGHFFSDDKNIAKRFLNEDSVQLKDTRTGRIIEAELDLKKPLDFTPEGLTTNKEQAQIIYEAMTGEKISPNKALEYIKDAYEEASGMGGTSDFYDEIYSNLKIKELAQKKGYDGIISHYGELDGKNIKEYGVFSANQIKIKPSPIKTGGVSNLSPESVSKSTDIPVGTKIEVTNPQMAGGKAIGIVKEMTVGGVKSPARQVKYIEYTDRGDTGMLETYKPDQIKILSPESKGIKQPTIKIKPSEKIKIKAGNDQNLLSNQQNPLGTGKPSVSSSQESGLQAPQSTLPKIKIKVGQPNQISFGKPPSEPIIPQVKFDSNKISVAHRDGNQLYVRDILTDKSPEVYKKAGNVPITFTYSNEKSVAGQPFMARLVAEPSTGRQVIEINKFYPYKNDVPKVLDKTIAEEIEHSLNFSGNPKMFENVYQGGNLNRYRNDPVERAASANLNKRFVGNVTTQGEIVNPGASGEVPKIKITKKTPEPYIDAQGELQFPGGPKKIEPFAKPDLDISDEAKGTASIIGGSSGIKASPEVKEYFANWTNARRASQVEGILKSREFTDLDSKGIEGILEFQAGNKTGRFSDVKNYFDNKFTQAKNEGLKLNYKQDYLPQMWLNPKGEVEAVFGNRLGLNPSFTFESIMKNYQEGIEAGLTPRFSKLSDLIGSYESRVNKSLADRKFFIRLKEDNLILPQSKAPTDWVTLDPDRFPRLSFTTDQGKYTGIYKAPEDLAKMINNYLADPSTSPNVVLKGLNTIANWTSSVKNRVLSFGVPGTAVNAHGFNILARNVMASKNPIEGAVTGIKYMLHPESAAKYLDSELIKAPDAVKHGLTLSANEFKSVLEEPQGFKTKFGDTWYKLFEKGLFDRMLPALKLQKYQEVVDGFIKSGMDETLAKRNAAKFTNDVFGGINWEEFGKSRDWQNIKRMFILAPDWLETNINLAKKTAKSTVNFSDKSLSAYRRFLATFLGSYVTMNVVNKLSSGHWMYQNDSGNTFNIEAGYTSDGQKRYIRPFGTAADFIRIPYDVANSLSQGDLQAPARVVRNRLSIPAGVGLGVFFDTDYTGQPIGWKGTDKYGGEMPAKQRLMGVGGELATLAGFPAFMKQGLDYTSGKTGLEQSLLQGLELPFRYSGGAYNKTQQKISDILKEQGASGEELYNANKGIKGLTFSDKDIQKIKVGGLDKFNEIQQSKENSAELKSKLKGEGYYTSKDAPKNLIEKTIVGTQALVTDPKQLVRAIFTKERLRKVENGFVVLERKEGLGQLDTEDKSTQIDHIVPLEFGGTNPTKSNEKILEETKGMTLEQRNAYLKKYNLEALDTQEHDLKTKYQNYLSAELKAKRMTKKEVTTKMANWKEEILKLPENVMGKIVKDALAVEDTETDNNNEVKTSGKIYTIKTTTTDSEGVETTTSKDYDITRPIEEPKYTGQAELDKKLKSAYKSSLIKRINDIVKVYEDGQIPADEAEKLIAEVKQLQGKSGTGRAKTLKIGKTSKLKSPTIKISSSIPKVSVHSPSIKISMPKTSQSKVKLPTFKKANLANNTVKVKQFRQPVVKIKNG